MYNQQQEPHDSHCFLSPRSAVFPNSGISHGVCSVSNPKCSLLRRSRLLTFVGSRYGGVCAAWDSVSSLAVKTKVFCSALLVKAIVLQSSWSASRTLMRFFIISKLEKKIMFTTHERRTETPRPTSVRSQY